MIEQFYSRSETITRLRSGPLGSHIDRFVETLEKQGYSPNVIRQKIHAVGALGQWLVGQHIDITSLDEQCILAFVEHRRRERCHLDGEPAALRELLRYLRQVGVVHSSEPTKADMRDPVEKAYADYLANERGLMAPTIRYNLFTARRFLSERFASGPFDCRSLCATDVTQFTLRHAHSYKLRSARTMLASLRVFLRFLYLRGETPNDLTGCVFRVADWHLAGLPSFLEPRQVEHLLQCVDQTARSGLRDYSIMLLLARLGLRGGEVVALAFEDIDWDAGAITVRGKSSWHNRLPVPQDVGEALVRYLRHGRPRCSSRKVFVRSVAPYGGLLTSSAITGMVRYHLGRAGLHPGKKGAHVLRHSLATRMIRGGNTLDEIGDILGHQFHSSTEIYAKVATTALRLLAQPWPGVRP